MNRIRSGIPKNNSTAKFLNLTRNQHYHYHQPKFHIKTQAEKRVYLIAITLFLIFLILKVLFTWIINNPLKSTILITVVVGGILLMLTELPSVKKFLNKKENENE